MGEGVGVYTEMNIKVDITGFDALRKRLAQVTGEVAKEVKKVNEATAQNIRADAIDNITQNESVDTGILRGSIYANSLNEGLVYEVGSNTGTGEKGGYGAYVEFGRRPGGKMPPIKDLAEWVRRKGIEKDETKARQRAFLIARSIAVNGIKPRPFLYPAFEANIRIWFNRMKTVLK